MKFEILYKYLNGESSEKENHELFDWIEESTENKDQFIKLKQAWSLSSNSKHNEKKSWKFLEKELFLKKENKKSSYNWMKYAAIITVFIGISALFYSPNKITESDSEAVVLESSTGFKTKFINDASQTIEDQSGTIIAEKSENQIIYSAQPDRVQKTIIFNTLKVPFGKTFNVTLSDGTRVQLNAGTILTYPENFAHRGERNVTLIGEAFFEVTPNIAQPFIVTTDQYNIEVLGTTFNVSAYPNDTNSNTVLVEGSVKLTQRDNTFISAILKPNDKGVWNAKEQRFEVNTINTASYTSWTRGELTFENAPFELIMKKLERSLNVSIQNYNEDLSHQNFSGTLKIENSDIETILDLLKLDTPFSYDKNGNKIIIHNRLTK
ncbi:MAG: FecR domain-containing protein [Gelidibacter sp.]